MAVAARPEVRQVLHPALPGAPGHEIWKRDFTGACSLFGVVFEPGYSADAVDRMVDALDAVRDGRVLGRLRKPCAADIGLTRTADSGQFGGAMLRLHIGLEDTIDLIADLEHGLDVLRQSA